MDKQKEVERLLDEYLTKCFVKNEFGIVSSIPDQEMIARKIVKLFPIPDVIKPVCGHYVKVTILGGKTTCAGCGIEIEL